MSGQIFISYRREESGWSARSLHELLSANFDPKQIFMDIDAIALGEDFVEAIETTVAKCDVLIAVIGKNWLTSKDEQGARQLDNPEDFVRMEIATALKRKIRVIPVLVDGALMPRSTELSDDLKSLVRRNAFRISNTTFHGDCQRLVATIRQVLEKAATEEAGGEEASITTPTPTPSVGSSDPAIYKNRAWDVYKKKEYDKAISDFNEAIRLDPKYADAYIGRGIAYYFKNEYDKAFSDFNEAIRLEPNAAIAYISRGNAYFEKKEYDKAISDFNEAIRFCPNYAEAYHNRGTTYYRKKEYDKAITDYNEAIRLNPNYANAYHNRGVAYSQQGNKAQAQAQTDFDTAKELGYSPQ